MTNQSREHRGFARLRLEFQSHRTSIQTPRDLKQKWPRKVSLRSYTTLQKPQDKPIAYSAPRAGAQGHLPERAKKPPHRKTANTHSPAAKSRTLSVRLISMAMTGYYRTMIRPRAHRPLSMLKYDPVVKKTVLFLEATKGGKSK
jgi:large subunit ribosomal protein L33